MIDDLELLLKSAVTGVLKTMLGTEPHTVPMDKDLVSAEPQIAGSVGFIGDMTGVVYIYATAAFATRMASIILGTPENEIDGEEMINDAVGELANMVAGNFRAALVEQGHSCVLTIPSIVRGSNFSIEAVTSTTRRVCCFRCNDGHNLVVEILMKPQD